MATAKGAKNNKGNGAGAEVDGLFRLPLMEFTAARNALASRLKKAGQAELADQVKSLAKPSVSAWVVNQLYWRHRSQFDTLIATGERFRTAQASQLAGKGADLRGPLEARRVALAELARLAADVLRDAGHSTTPETMRRITITLEALSTYGQLPEAPPAGRLTDDVDPPGFETLAALVPRVGRSSRGDGPTRIIAFQQHQPRQKPAKKRGGSPEEQALQREEERKAQRAAAKAALDAAEDALREARRTAQQAEAALKKAAARAKAAEQERAAAEQQLEKAAKEADEARHQARRVAAGAEEAAQVVDEAERALEKARAELAALD
jgi:hypothetical protein